MCLLAVACAFAFLRCFCRCCSPCCFRCAYCCCLVCFCASPLLCKHQGASLCRCPTSAEVTPASDRHMGGRVWRMVSSISVLFCSFRHSQPQDEPRAQQQQQMRHTKVSPGVDLYIPNIDQHRSISLPFSLVCFYMAYRRGLIVHRMLGLPQIVEPRGP